MAIGSGLGSRRRHVLEAEPEPVVDVLVGLVRADRFSLISDVL